jgi:hypothetical protein
MSREVVSNAARGLNLNRQVIDVLKGNILIMQIRIYPGNEMNTTVRTPCINRETIDDFDRSIQSRNSVNVRCK